MMTLTVTPELHGQRVDAALAQLVPAYSRSQLTSWLKRGLIKVNDQQLKPKEKVQSGDTILLDIEEACLENRVYASLPESIPLNIIYEDEQLMVINKPAGMVVHPGAGNREHTLVNALLHHNPDSQYLPRAGIIHRLDKETTGLLIIAKTLVAHTNLIRQMQERTIQRRYITLVQGHVISGGEIDTFYGRHPRSRLKMAVLTHGKEAITQYTLKTQYQFFTLLNVQLLTGRTHQIRVHMAHINHPVVGDPLYGGRMRYPAEADEKLLQILQQFKRQALHAATLSFNHPEGDEVLTFEAPLPEDFEELLQTLKPFQISP